MGKQKKGTGKEQSERKKASAAPLGVAVPEMQTPSPLSDPGVKKKERSKFYEHELRLLHIELATLQEWVKQERRKVVLIFEGRDAATPRGLGRRRGRLDPQAGNPARLDKLQQVAVVRG